MPRLVWRALGKSPFHVCPPLVNLSFDFSKNTVYLYSTNQLLSAASCNKLLIFKVKPRQMRASASFGQIPPNESIQTQNLATAGAFKFVSQYQ